MRRERTPSSIASPPASDDAGASRLSEEQLRARSRAAGLVLSLSFLIPCDTSHDGPRFLWELARDLRPVSLWVLLAPAVCGALLVASSFACRRAASLAIVALAAALGLLLVISVGAEALAWDMLPEPDLSRSSPSAGLLAVAWTASGVGLYPAIKTRRAARVLLAMAALSAAAHLALPAFGEPPGLMIARVVSHVAASSGQGNLLSACMLSLVVLWPPVAVAAGFLYTRGPAPRPRSLMLLLAACGAPITLLPVVERSMANPWGGSGAAITVVSAMVVLAAMLVVLAFATSFLAERITSLPEGPERRTAIISLAMVAMATLGTSRLGRPSNAITAFRPGPFTKEGDRLFGALLPAWNDARRKGDLGEPRPSGGDVADVPAAEAKVVSSARDLDAGLGIALSALVSEAARADVMERRWYSLVEHVNEATRRAGLPYYVDPMGVVGTSGDPSRRWFRIDTYRIEAVNRFMVAGRELTALHVRAMSQERTRLAAMGISRDLQPYAVVALDEMQTYQAELEQLSARAPPRCGEGQADSQAAEDALRACGEVLLQLTQKGELGAALLSGTERHELQHQIDGPAMARSGWLRRRLAWHAPWARSRIERELSAYLAQMTAAGAAPRVTLIRLLRMALLVRKGTEHEMALLAFEALGDGEKALARGEPVARAYQSLVGLDDAALRGRAVMVWQKVVSGELASVSPR